MRFSLNFFIVALFATVVASASLENSKKCFPSTCDCNEDGCTPSSPACCAVSAHEDPPHTSTLPDLRAERKLPLLNTVLHTKKLQKDLYWMGLAECRCLNSNLCFLENKIRHSR
ncbi:hypothetical protein B0H11DRAFT_2075082 [Mycena galericulata]|nr:hypothetical protein B0H11DRAFT_2075082 [Mycena galericulata]